MLKKFIQLDTLIMIFCIKQMKKKSSLLKACIVIFFLLINFHLSSQDYSKLKLKLDVGDSYLYEVNESSNTEQLVMGEEQRHLQNDSYSIMLDVINISADSIIKIKATYKHFSSSFEDGGYLEGFHTDSLKENPSSVAEYFKSICGKSFQVELKNSGHIISFSNLDYIFKPQEHLEFDSISMNMLKSKFAEESFQNILFAIKYPSKDSQRWFISDTVPNGILNVYKREYQLKDSGNSFGTYLYTANIFTHPETSVKAGNVYISYDMSGNLAAHIKTNVQTGIIKEFRCSQKFKGYASMKYSAGSDHAYSWPIEISNTIIATVTKINE